MAEAFTNYTILAIAHQGDYSAGKDLIIKLDSGNIVRLQRRSIRTREWVASY